MNVAKPGGPSGGAPIASEASPSPAGPSSPAGPERRFADVLSGKAGAVDNKGPVAKPFQVPILDDGPARVGGASKLPSHSLNVERTNKVHGAFRSIEVAGEKAGRTNLKGQGGVEGGGATGWQRLAEDTMKSENKLDSLIKSAQGGKAFNAQELMALQIEVFRYSQTVEVISRTTDKLVGALKQTLGTQV